MQFIDGRFRKFGIVDVHVNDFDAGPVGWRNFETRFQTLLKPGIRFGLIDRPPVAVELAESPAGDKNGRISFGFSQPLGDKFPKLKHLRAVGFYMGVNGVMNHILSF